MGSSSSRSHRITEPAQPSERQLLTEPAQAEADLAALPSARSVLTESDADDIGLQQKRPSGRGVRLLLALAVALLALIAAFPALWRHLREEQAFCSAGLAARAWGSRGAPAEAGAVFSVRVAKALGSRGYDLIRLSAVRDAQSASEQPRNALWSWPWCAPRQRVDWTYTSEFHERWAHLHISSAVVPVVPGEAQIFDVYGETVRVKVPRKDDGVVGLVVGDVCFGGVWPCAFAGLYDPKNTLLSVIHALVEHDNLDYWVNIGDLFYDADGGQTLEFFSELSLDAQAKIHTMTIGNHDLWYHGEDSVCQVSGIYQERRICDFDDNLGFGFMQWYAQDAISAKENATQPFHFHTSPSPGEVAHFSNFFWYNMVGNVVLISFSGHSGWELQAPYFEEACDWAQAQGPALLVLLGHWNVVNAGAAQGMSTPQAYEKMMAIPGCAAIGAARAKFIDGHTHCNVISQDGTGFQFGSFGASGCGNFGIPILDTRNGHAILWYFPLGAYGARATQWQDVLDCLKTRGLDSCTHYAEVWMKQPLTPPALTT